VGPDKAIPDLLGVWPKLLCNLDDELPRRLDELQVLHDPSWACIRLGASTSFLYVSMQEVMGEMPALDIVVRAPFLLRMSTKKV
jgi:hypothetical protein